MPQRDSSDRERIAVLEKVAVDHEDDIRELSKSLRGLTEALGKASMRMEKSFSFFGGVAFAFGSLGGLAGAAITYIIEYVARK